MRTGLLEGSLPLQQHPLPIWCDLQDGPWSPLQWVRFGPDHLLHTQVLPGRREALPCSAASLWELTVQCVQGAVHAQPAPQHPETWAGPDPTPCKPDSDPGRGRRSPGPCTPSRGAAGRPCTRAGGGGPNLRGTWAWKRRSPP